MTRSLLTPSKSNANYRAQCEQIQFLEGRKLQIELKFETLEKVFSVFITFDCPN